MKLFILSILFVNIAFSKDKVKVNLATVFSNKKVYRGAVYWDEPTLSGGPSFIFFNTVSLEGSGLSVFKTSKKYGKFSLGLNWFNDDEPGFALKIKKSEEDYKNLRKSTFGVFFKHKYKFKNYFKISSLIHRDVKAFKGFYYDIKVSTQLIPLLSIGFGKSYGDLKSNQYAYGERAEKGVGHIEGFVSLFLPILPWKGKLISTLTQTQIVKGVNVNSNYVRGRKKNNILSLLAIWNL